MKTDDHCWMKILHLFFPHTVRIEINTPRKAIFNLCLSNCSVTAMQYALYYFCLLFPNNCHFDAKMKVLLVANTSCRSQMVKTMDMHDYNKQCILFGASKDMKYV